MSRSIMISVLLILQRIMIKMVNYLPMSQLESFICRLVSAKVNGMPFDEALRLLFRLDTSLYTLQGQKAIEYDGGIHTKHRHTRYHQFFTDNVKAGENVLDVGCGIGALAYDVAEKANAYVVGVDIDQNNIVKAQQQYSHPHISYLVGDVLQKLPDGSFDVVILSNVIEHLIDRITFLQHIWEMIHPSRLLIRVPLYERDWRVPLKRELGVEWRLDSTHETEYSLESFAEEMAAAGLKINQQEVRWGEIWAVTIPNV